jgi:hypothetical protein
MQLEDEALDVVGVRHGEIVSGLRAQGSGLRQNLSTTYSKILLEP